MNKKWNIAVSLVVGTTLALAVNQSSTQYFENALKIIEENAAYSNRIDWPALRASLSVDAARVKTAEDVYPLIRKVIANLRDRHSQLFTPQEAQALSTGSALSEFGLRAIYPENLIATVFANGAAAAAGLRTGDSILEVNGRPPQGSAGRLQLGKGTVQLKTRRFEDGAVSLVTLKAGALSLNAAPRALRFSDLGYLELPLHLGQGEIAGRGSYADLAHSAIRSVDANGICGWMIDLRRNQGGNFWPMLAAVGPILGEGKSGGFFANSEVAPWEYRAGSAVIDGQVAARAQQPYTLQKSLPPVAVLTSRLTASSGEALTVSFRGRPQTRSFGEATAGVPTANQPFPLEDGALLNLTVAFDADRNGRVYETRLAVNQRVESNWQAIDSASDPVVGAAAAWLRTQPGCKP